MERYADEVDMASAQEQRRLDAALEAARNRGKVRMAPKGSCHNCDEPLDAGRLFCDADCRDDYQLRMAARKRS